MSNPWGVLVEDTTKKNKRTYANAAQLRSSSDRNGYGSKLGTPIIGWLILN
jgi:hypothetical protein